MLPEQGMRPINGVPPVLPELSPRIGPTDPEQPTDSDQNNAVVTTALFWSESVVQPWWNYVGGNDWFLLGEAKTLLHMLRNMLPFVVTSEYFSKYEWQDESFHSFNEINYFLCCNKVKLLSGNTAL